MLSISNVETFYGNIQALRGVNVKVNSGEIVSLIGSNGAGKSTLLMTISGVNKAATGEIKFDDKNIESLPQIYHTMSSSLFSFSTFFKGRYSK